MNRLGRLFAALKALNWKRGLTCLAIVLAVAALLHWTAYSLILHGVMAGLDKGFPSLPPPTHDPDVQLMADRAMRSWGRGWLWPFLVAAGFTAFLWIRAGFGADGGHKARKLEPRAKAIRTRRLVLRRPAWEDHEAMHAICSDPETLRLWDRLPYATIEESESWMERLCALNPETSDMFMVEREGRLIGFVGSMSYPWVTFLLAKSEWRQGYASEALGAFTLYMEGRGIEELHAATHPDNAAALALLRKTGFEEYARSTGLFTVAGEPGAAVHFKRIAPAKA